MSSLLRVVLCTCLGVLCMLPAASTCPAVESPSMTSAGPALLINEIVATNSRGLKDPQGQYDDWIELYNAGTTTVNIAGMYLTNDGADPLKWRVPTDRPALTTIQPHGYLLIWADGDTASPGLHAGFRLDADGGQLALFATDGLTLLDSVEFGPQTADISYGRNPAAVNEWRFLVLPTPGALNTSAYAGVVAELKFSHERGFYAEPLTVEITTATPGASIFYTVDGSAPAVSPQGVATGRPYTGPVPIATTTNLRAVATKAGWMSTKVATHTYFFLDDVIRQATNPATGAQVVPAGYPTSWPGGSTSGAVTGDYQVDPDVVGQNGQDKFGGLYARTIKRRSQGRTDSVPGHESRRLVRQQGHLHRPVAGRHRTRRIPGVHRLGPPRGSCRPTARSPCKAASAAAARAWTGGRIFKLSMRPRFKSQTDDGTPTGGPSKLRFPALPAIPPSRQLQHRSSSTECLNHSWLHSDGSQRYTALTSRTSSWPTSTMRWAATPRTGSMPMSISTSCTGACTTSTSGRITPGRPQMFGGSEDEYDALKHSSGSIVNSGTGGNASANFNAMLSAANAVSADPTNTGKVPNPVQLARRRRVHHVPAGQLVHRQPRLAGQELVRDTPQHAGWQMAFPLLGRRTHARRRQSRSAKARRASMRSSRATPTTGCTSPIWSAATSSMTAPSTPTGAAALFKARMSQLDRAIVGESARWGDNRRHLALHATGLAQHQSTAS